MHRRGSKCSESCPHLQICVKKRIELTARGSVRELIEFALLGDQSGSTHEPTPGRARKRTADADSPHAERGDLLERKFARRSYEQIERLRRDGSHDGRDLIPPGNTRRIEAIGTGLCV